jgi:deazaflavin-dependent oxidoreductase (nitroreductase family)
MVQNRRPENTGDKSVSDPANVLDFMKDHIARYIATDGEDGHMMNGNPCLVLTTTGKKSGEPRQAAVIYGRHGDDYVVVASKGGSDKAPAWYLNLMANPESQIQVLADKMTVRPRVAEGEERQQLWDMMAEIFPDYLDYQKKTERQIPVVVLERT